jgi:GNAT superfamily N-acetyltransferase
MRVRRATRGDLVGIRRVADASFWEEYRSLLGPAAIAEMIGREFSPAALKRRLLGGGVIVAEDEGGRVIGFADVRNAGDHVELAALSTDPVLGRRGVAGALVNAARDQSPDLPLCADVLLGNLESEELYESLGFAPGEVIQQRLRAEPVVARRWWSSPGSERGTSVVV